MDRGQLSSGKKEKKDIIVFAMDTALVSSWTNKAVKPKYCKVKFGAILGPL